MLFSCERSAPHELLRALREWAQSAVGSCRVERWHEGNVLFNFNVNVQATVSQCAVYNPAQTPHAASPVFKSARMCSAQA
jgi:hypothetical protein